MIDVNGVSLMVRESGDGEPLVLVHGSWDDRHAWVLAEPGLAESFGVVAYDRRGHSDSGGGEGHTRRDDEDDLAALIEARCGGSAHVAANSFGGSIALGLAARRPELFRSLCVHEPPLMSLAADDPMVAGLGEGLGPVVELIERGDGEAAGRAFVEMVLGPGAWEQLPAGERARMAGNAPTFAGEMADPGMAEVDTDALGRAELPILLSHGDQSPPFFATIVERLAEAAGGLEVKTIAGAGHVPHVTNPAPYVGLVKRFARAR